MIGPSTRLNQDTHVGAGAYGTAFPGSEDRARPRVDPPVSLHAAGDGAGRRGGQHGGSSKSQPPRRDATPSGDVCRLLSLLADRTRLKILRILSGGERPVVALTAELRLPQPTVSHHLAWLRMMDLVSPRRQGKHVYYALGAAAKCDEKGVLTLTADDATVTITPDTAE